MKWSVVVFLAIVLLPGDAHGQRANSPSDATVFVRLVGSVHVEVDDTAIGGGRRTADIDHIEIGSGSGFVISPYGYVLTNEHVIANAERLLARATGGKAKIAVTISRIDVCFPQSALAAYGLASQCAQASVSASDPALDLALLFVSGTNFPYIALGDSDAATAGLAVDTLGYPFGREVEVGRIASAPDLVPEISTTPGAISALRAGEAGERRYLQITNTLNPGNSGGPLIDRDGFAVGVIRMKLVNADGIGFAIPINAAKDFLESHGLDQLMPTRRLRLAPFQRLEAKGVGLRMAESLTDVSPFRSHVESDPRDAPLALRIDRVVSPWSLKQLEQALLSSQSFESGSLTAAPPQGPARAADGPTLLGHAVGTAADGKRPVALDYGIVDLGAEKLMARYVGTPEQLAFNASVLRESLTSLEGTRFLAGGIDRVDSLEWTAVPMAIGQRLLPAPSGWIAEASGPSACAALPPAAAVTTFFPAADSTITMRAAVWSQGDIRPDSAASSCSSRRGSVSNASYASRVDFLGVSYVIEGVFASIGTAQVIQLEVVAPDRNSTFARGLLAAWLAKTTQ
ncbi:MAG TPA: trypsin-like peptidase domain-containing protein [Vicinamibacterales bacterium]|nr:trypsin-like peptidase domain-containing protein [Vicinamibacterales bacterium]